MINKAIIFFLCQTSLEKIMFMYFLTLLTYMVIVAIIKRWHRKYLGVFMLREKNMLCNITYFILGVYLVASCTVIKVAKSPLVYMGCMAVAAIAVNYLYILGIGIKKFKDIEFSDAAADALQDVVNDCLIHDRISDYKAAFIEYINLLDEDIVNSLEFQDFTCYWIACITDYLDDRINCIDYFRISDDDQIINNYIKNIIAKESLWYTDIEIFKFTRALRNNEEVILSANSRVIPITTKRYECLVYVKGNDKLCDYDRNFIIETYTVLSLL